MQRALKAALCGFGLAALLTTPARVQALMMAPGPIPQRVGQADTIILGKVKRIEKKAVTLPLFPGAEEKGDYLVAVVEIQDALKGAKGVTSLKVGLLQPPPLAPQDHPGGGNPVIDLPLRPGRGMPSLVENQEACLFLRPHPSGEFYVMQMYFDVIDKTSTNFEKEVKLARKCAKLLANPDKGFQSSDPHERLLTAALLVSRFRTPPLHSQGEPKQEKVAAELSKKILNTLAEADWTERNDPELGYTPAQNLFYQLGITEQDGYTPPPDDKQVKNAAKAWVVKHANTYRIQRFVDTDASKDPRKENK
jgi:hypothetical protein